MVELDPEIVVTIVDYAGVKDFIADMYDGPVDVVSREGLKPLVRPLMRSMFSAIETELGARELRLTPEFHALGLPSPIKVHPRRRQVRRPLHAF
jgi:hypothetical protein